MDFPALKAELAGNHPNGDPYSADDATAALQLNVPNCTENKTSLTGSEVLNAIAISEFEPLSPEDKQTVWDVVHLGTINPFGVEATLFIEIFGLTSVTITALKAARVTAVTRASQLNLGRIREGEVQYARAMTNGQ